MTAPHVACCDTSTKTYRSRRTGDLAGNDLPLQTTGEENWATSTDALVDGIQSSCWDFWMQSRTVYVRQMFNVIQDHPVEPEKCLFCAGVTYDTAVGMHVPAMTPAIVAVKPFTWLA
jgi:hypothetical protein